MSERELRFRIHRILVPVESAPDTMAALEKVVELARKLEAELLGLFVEDINLLRLADSPYAREFLYHSAAEVPISRASMEGKLRAQSERARKTLESAGTHAQVRCSFRTVRGEVVSEILAAASQVDLLAIVKAGSLRQRFRMGPTVLQIAQSAVPVLLLPERGIAPGARVLVRYDGSPSSRQRLVAAAELARLCASALTVLLALAPEGLEHRLEMQKEIDSLLAGYNIDIHHRLVDPMDEQSVPRAIRLEDAGVVVLGHEELLKTHKRIGDLLHGTRTAVLILGNGVPSQAG